MSDSGRRGRRLGLLAVAATLLVLGVAVTAGASAGAHQTDDSTDLSTTEEFVLPPDGSGLADATALTDVAESVSSIGPGATDSPSSVVTNATGETDDGNIETTYASIDYHEEYAEEAESIAAVVDDHVRVLHQKFGEQPGDTRQPIYVGPSEEFVIGCTEYDGCVDPLGTVYLSSDSRSLLHHELVHVIQLRTHYEPTLADLIDPDPATAEGAIIEGTARYLDSTPSSIADGARFDPDAIELTPFPSSGTEYDERALFAEFVLAEYDRAAFDALVVEGDVEALEDVTGDDFADIESAFYDGLDEQEARLQDGGATLPAFTYEPFVASPGEEISFDARTPEAVVALDRAWYPTEPDEFAWDLTGDGEIDETGPTATHAFEDADEPTEVTLIVTVDGDEHETTQQVLLADRFEILDVEFPEGATAGDTVEATVTVENQRERTQTETVEYGLEDGPVVDEDVELGPDEQTSVSLMIEVPDDADGTLDQSVTVGGNTETEPLEVTQRTDDRPEADDEMADSIPGFGFVTAAGTLLAVAAIARVWSR